MDDDEFCRQIRRLMLEKRELKAKIRNCYATLCENRNIGLCGSLQDARGLPRQDIDVREVMRIRKNIMHMEIAYDQLMKEIRRVSGELCSSFESDDEDSLMNPSYESNVDSCYSQRTADQDRVQQEPACCQKTATKSPPPPPSPPPQSKCDEVIAVIVRVFPKSPARKTGLRSGDCILQFGPIDASNYDGNPVSLCVLAQQFENKNIPMRILRNGKELKKKIKPKHWCGCGLLGFLIDR